jgi:hypothetical protein
MGRAGQSSLRSSSGQIPCGKPRNFHSYDQQRGWGTSFIHSFIKIYGEIISLKALQSGIDFVPPNPNSGGRTMATVSVKPLEVANTEAFERLFDDLMAGELTELDEEDLLGDDFYWLVA